MLIIFNKLDNNSVNPKDTLLCFVLVNGYVVITK